MRLDTSRKLPRNGADKFVDRIRSKLENRGVHGKSLQPRIVAIGVRRQKGAWLRLVFERAIAAPLVRIFSNVVHGLAGLRLSLEPQEVGEGRLALDSGGKNGLLAHIHIEEKKLLPRQQDRSAVEPDQRPRHGAARQTHVHLGRLVGVGTSRPSIITDSGRSASRRVLRKRFENGSRADSKRGERSCFVPKNCAFHNAMTGWPSAKIRRTIAATAASADATKASLPTSSVLPRGKAGLVVRRNLSASAIFFFPCRPLASGSRVNRSAYTTRNLCLTENAQQASRFPLRSRGRRYAQEHD